MGSEKGLGAIFPIFESFLKDYRKFDVWPAKFNFSGYQNKRNLPLREIMSMINYVPTLTYQIVVGPTIINFGILSPRLLSYLMGYVY